MRCRLSNKGATIMIHTHHTAPTQFVEANGIRFAYRRFGKTGGVPIVFNQHYTGTMDYWDPAVTDGLARDREVILFNNAGVSSSSGEGPRSEEHTSELQSQSNLVCRLLLEKKNPPPDPGPHRQFMGLLLRI